MDVETATNIIASLEEQLQSLYAEKEQLDKALGISSADDIITMVRSLEEQLDSLYEERSA